MRDQSGKNRIHYAFLVLAVCCVMQGTTLGMVANCSGIYYTPVCNELGFEMAGLTLYRTIATLCSAFFMPSVARLIRTRDIRKVLSIAALIYGLSTASMGFYHQLWNWYIGGVIQSIAGAFLMMLPAPIILRNWFHKSTGTAISISAACSGIFGIITSAALGRLIPLIGWRACYIISGLIVIVCLTPLTAFVIRYSPKDMNMSAYGEDEASAYTAQKKAGSEKKNTISLFQALKSPAFLLVAAVNLSLMYATGFTAFLTSFGVSIGMTFASASLLSSFSLGGNTSYKFVIGNISDRAGAVKAYIGSILITMTGVVLLLIASPVTIYGGAFFYGITLPLTTVMTPLLIAERWEGDDYGAIYSYTLTLSSILSSPSSIIFGRIFDRTGSFQLCLYIILGLFAVGLSAIIIFWNYNRREIMSQC